jgi:arginine decarboxylase-like protein
MLLSQSGALSILDLAADTLESEGSEFLLKQSEVDALVQAAEELRRQVVESDLTQNVKQIILESLDRIDEALRNYALGGLDGIDRAVKEAYGAAIVEHAAMMPQKDNPLVRGYWDWLGRVNATVSTCKTAYAAGEILSDKVSQFLEYLN